MTRTLIQFSFTLQEREEWVTAIEQQILTSLQCNESSKAKVHIYNSSVLTAKKKFIVVHTGINIFLIS